MRVGFVELRIVIVVGTRVIDDITNVIAELRAGTVATVQVLNQLRGYIVLELAILYATEITNDMKHQLAVLRDRFADIWKMLNEIIMIGRQVQWPRQRLKARIAMTNSSQRGDT